MENGLSVPAYSVWTWRVCALRKMLRSTSSAGGLFKNCGLATLVVVHIDRGNSIEAIRELVTDDVLWG